MKNTIEQNTFEVPPEKQFPVISPELREKAKVIAEFRAELRQNLLVEPRKEPSSFTIRTKGNIVIDYDISTRNGETKIRVRSIQNVRLKTGFGLQIMRNLEEMIELTEAITACIDVIQKPRKHGIKSLSFDYKNSEADIVGETLEGEEVRLKIFDYLNNIEEKNLLIKAIITSTHGGSVPIPSGTNI